MAMVGWVVAGAAISVHDWLRPAGTHCTLAACLWTVFGKVSVGFALCGLLVAILLSRLVVPSAS